MSGSSTPLNARGPRSANLRTLPSHSARTALETMISPSAAAAHMRAEICTVAVMFTKIVGVSEVTGEHGDDAARELTAAHDVIVRAAIETFGGREIKHLGDGIMASFRQTSAAVEAAIRMQREAHENGGEEVDRRFGMCVGINAGEPIAEDDDLFGATVQIAARMCAAAAVGEIMVSNAVRALCDGKGLSFANLGSHAFKGVEEPLIVYAADWQSSPEN